MASQTMLAGMKFSITGTQNSHDAKMDLVLFGVLYKDRTPYHLPYLTYVVGDEYPLRNQSLTDIKKSKAIICCVCTFTGNTSWYGFAN